MLSTLGRGIGFFADAAASTAASLGTAKGSLIASQRGYGASGASRPAGVSLRNPQSRLAIQAQAVAEIEARNYGAGGRRSQEAPRHLQVRNARAHRMRLPAACHSCCTPSRWLGWLATRRLWCDYLAPTLACASQVTLPSQIAWRRVCGPGLPDEPPLPVTATANTRGVSRCHARASPTHATSSPPQVLPAFPEGSGTLPEILYRLLDPAASVELPAAGTVTLRDSDNRELDKLVAALGRNKSTWRRALMLHEWLLEVSGVFVMVAGLAVGWAGISVWYPAAACAACIAALPFSAQASNAHHFVWLPPATD